MLVNVDVITSNTIQPSNCIRQSFITFYYLFEVQNLIAFSGSNAHNTLERAVLTIVVSSIETFLPFKNFGIKAHSYTFM